MSKLGFGRFEFLRIEKGELTLDPCPIAVREVKLGSRDPGASKAPPDEFELKPQIADLFEYVRATDVGEIRTLVIHHGIPFTMEVDHRSLPPGGNLD